MGCTNNTGQNPTTGATGVQLNRNLSKTPQKANSNGVILNNRNPKNQSNNMLSSSKNLNYQDGEHTFGQIGKNRIDNDTINKKYMNNSANQTKARQESNISSNVQSFKSNIFTTPRIKSTLEQIPEQVSEQYKVLHPPQKIIKHDSDPSLLKGTHLAIKSNFPNPQSDPIEPFRGNFNWVKEVSKQNFQFNYQLVRIPVVELRL